LVVGDQPGWKEKMRGLPLVGETGEVLENELRRVGLSLEDFRLTNLWLHDEAPEELEWHKTQLVRELAGRKLVLAMGAKVVMALTGQKVSDVTGLEVRSPFLPKGTRLLASVNPAIVFKEGSVVGELRLAIERFAEAVGKLPKKRR
jgi:uracil-DNA glycosylase family 4